MFTLSGVRTSSGRRPAPIGAGVIWAVVLAVALVGAAFGWLHTQDEATIQRTGTAATAVAEARVDLAEAQHLILAGAPAAAEAATKLVEVDQDLSLALDRLGAGAGSSAFQSQVVAHRLQIQAFRAALARGRPPEELDAEATTLRRDIESLDRVARQLWQDAGVRLDQLFSRMVMGIAVLLAAVVGIVWLISTAAGRSRAAHLRAAAESQRQNKLLGAIADGTTDAVFVKDREGRYLYANRATADFVRKPLRDLIGKDDRTLFDPQSADALIAHDARLMNENRTETFEETVHVNGEAKTFLVTKGPLHDDDGAVIGLIGVSCDITARKRDEQALRESAQALRVSEERYRRFLDVLPDAVFVLEQECIAFCNPAFVHLRGATSASAIIGTSVFEMYAPDVHRAVRARLDELFSRDVPLAPVERRLLRLDGRTVPVLVSTTQVIDADKRTALVVLRDLSRQHHAEAWAQLLLNNTRDAIFSTDQFGTVTSFNPAAERVFGWSAADIVGRSVQTLLPDVALEALTQGEVSAQRYDGSTVPLEIAVSAFDLDGEQQLIAVARDISEHRKLEAELRQAHKMEALGQVAGGVAHDFNNLLTVILGYSDMLQEQFPEGDPRRQFASDIRRASGRAADLTRQLLTFSRRTVVAPKVVDVNAVVRDMNRMLRRVLGEDVELAIGLDAEARTVFIDPGSLEQIVMNLCVNARDAMPRGGQLTITTAHVDLVGREDATGRTVPAGSCVTIAVADTGEGISPDVAAHIFEPFFTTKGAGKGTGLGLAVVQGVVEQNRGAIFLDTVMGRGTTFTIALPVANEPAVASHELRATAPKGGGETVLVVEDEEPVRRLAVIALASAGYRVLDAPDGQAAIDVFDRHRTHVDVVLTDVVMPHLSGRELAESLLARRPDLRVIFTSGYADDAVLRHGISKSDVPFLAKPYTPTTLLSKVREVIELPPANPWLPPPA